MSMDPIYATAEVTQHVTAERIARLFDRLARAAESATEDEHARAWEAAAQQVRSGNWKLGGKMQGGMFD